MNKINRDEHFFNIISQLSRKCRMREEPLGTPNRIHLFNIEYLAVGLEEFFSASEHKSDLKALNP